MEIKNLSFEYKKINYCPKKIFENLNLKTKENICCFIGPNGCGKTTLMDVISGNLKDYSGTIKINEKSIGYVKDTPEFITNTICEELQNSMVEHKYNGSIKRINDVLLMVNLQKDMNAKISSLTYCEKKLLSLACELIYNPNLLIIDSLTEGLDDSSKKNIIKILLILKKRYNKKIIIASNDIEFVHKIADRVFVIYDGKIVLEGSKYDVFKSDLYKYKLDIPNIIKFEQLVLEKKNIRLGYRDEINDLIKDIYRNSY